MLDTLEYIHEHEYVHADIKASNLMLSYSDPNQVYLVDYGLAYRYCPEGVHKEYKEDPKRCHDGTIEFTSIDAHKGATPSRRGDLEILCYCMVQWLCGQLPWEDRLQDPIYVRDSKIRFRDNVSEFMSLCFSSQDKPDELQRFMEEVKKLGYQDKPSYDTLRSILQTGLKSIQAKDNGKLEFNTVNGTTSAQKATKRKKKVDDHDDENDSSEESPVKKKRTAKKKEVNGVKKSPRKNPKAKKTPKFTEMGTQTSPRLIKNTRGKPKKNDS